MVRENYTEISLKCSTIAAIFFTKIEKIAYSDYSLPAMVETR